jgi:membrane fusion protein (multidrug efflux system)
MNSRTIVCWLPLLLALAACSGKEAAEAAKPLAHIAVATVQPGDLVQTVMLYGVVENGSQGRYKVEAPLEARLVSVDVSVGSVVAAGTVLAHLQASPLTELELDKARTDVQQTTAASARTARLRGEGLASDADVELAHAALANSEALLNSLQNRSNTLALKAPVAAVVGSIDASPGEIIAAGGSVFTLVRNSSITLHFSMDPALATQVSIGTALQIRLPAGGTELAGTVSSVSPAVDPQTHLLSVYASVPVANGLHPGENLRAQLGVQRVSGELLIPYDALLDDGGQAFVYVVHNAIASRRDVSTGATDGEHIVIVDGLKTGEQIAVTGLTGLDDGVAVQVQ